MKLISFLLNVFLIIISVSIVMCTIAVIIYLIKNFIFLYKKLYIFLNLKNIENTEFSERQQTYRKEHRQTGYSINRKYNSVTEHYTIENVFDGYARNTTIHFKNGKKLTLVLKENSILYKKLKH